MPFVFYSGGPLFVFTASHFDMLDRGDLLVADETAGQPAAALPLHSVVRLILYTVTPAWALQDFL